MAARPSSPNAAGKPRVLGLTGGIGSGKSAALEAFSRLGAAVLSSDAVVHACYEDPEIVARVRERFGDDVIATDGSVDRPRLGEAIFGDDDARRFLEGLIHPRVGLARERWREQESARDPRPPLLVCEVPLLFEVGLENTFDAVVTVTASEDVRRRRVEERGQDFDARRGTQMPEDEKIARSHEHYVNDGDLDDLAAWARAVFDRYAVDG